MINEWLFFLPGGLLGALLCGLLAMLGVWLRLKQEAIAAFSYSQVAVLGAMLALLLLLPAWTGAWLLALMAGLVLMWLRHLGRKEDEPATRHGGQAQLILLVTAWATALLVADNHPEALLLSTSAIEGQLLLIRWHDWPGFLLLMAVGSALLIWTSKQWLAAQLLPWRSAARDWRLDGLREIAVVTLLAAGTLGLGVFVTLALIVLPAWAVWNRASGWHQALWQAGLIGVLAHGIAFALALHFDQVYSAILILVLAVLAGIWALWLQTHRI